APSGWGCAGVPGLPPAAPNRSPAASRATGNGSGHHPPEGDVTMSSEERQPGAAPSVFDDMYPYRGRYETFATLPPTGRDRGEILDALRHIARGEDARWETGRISGSYYHGGKDHYAFLNEIF